MKFSLSWPNHFLKAMPINTIELGISFNMNFGEDANIQTFILNSEYSANKL
jgi:hypothetical protein